MRAKSISAKTTEEALNSLEECLADGFTPMLAIVFLSISQNRQAIVEMLHNKRIEIVGATTSGEFTDVQETKGGIAILLLDLPRSCFGILFEEMAGRSLEAVTANLARHAMQQFQKPALILCSTLFAKSGDIIDGYLLVKNIGDVFGPGITMFGGMAGDDISFSGTFVFTDGKETDNGLVALVLDEERVSLHGVAISGWKPMGLVRTVTRSEGNLVYTIDDQPALEIYLRCLGKDAATAEDRVRFFDSITVHYPFLVERENMEPKICGPVGYDKERGALICESNMSEGARFRFSCPPDFEIIDTVIEKARAINSGVAADADAMLIFSCAGRLNALGPMAQQENEGLQKVWNVPMAGFYTYGEFGKGINGMHEFHSTTNSWVVIKEKQTMQ